ncbi:MAG: GNAT family N-acetyltransferase [Rhizobiaceae bacterium]|nr:GNAT family N-acetyltransferase [Rhizobiaceae bacterium]
MSPLFVTYMEQVAPPDGSPLSPPLDAVSFAREMPATETYLELYRAIGGPLMWDERLRMSDCELKHFLSSPSTALFILRQSGKPVGLCEFDGFAGREVELKHFGLTPEAQGKRLGPYLLDRAVRAVWLQNPDRIWLHTDTNDHPKAKSTYERSGFRVFHEAWEDFPD